MAYGLSVNLQTSGKHLCLLNLHPLPTQVIKSSSLSNNILLLSRSFPTATYSPIIVLVKRICVFLWTKYSIPPNVIGVTCGIERSGTSCLSLASMRVTSFW